jgi:hypothetical protein
MMPCKPSFPTFQNGNGGWCQKGRLFLMPKKLEISYLYLLIVTAMFVIFLTGPDQHLETYLLSFAWGLRTGWKWMCNHLVVS